MTNSKATPERKGPIDWRDIILRAAVPGFLLAIAGFVSEWVITSSSSKAENARLVTDLQIQREQAESDLRKDIFSKAVEALIGDAANQGTIENHSKRLLKLELLALNFGDSIFLSPLFGELEKDLRRHMKAQPADGLSVLQLIDRLRSLAKRVSIEQLSFLSQRGTSVQIPILLTGDGKGFCNGNIEYKWPDDDYADLVPCRNEGDSDEEGITAGLPVCRTPKETEQETTAEASEESDEEPEGAKDTHIREYLDLLKSTASIALKIPDAEERYVTAVFSEPKPNRASVRVSLSICKFNDDFYGCDSTDKKTVERTFTLDYFNFPTIDNTRLPNNDRFAVVLSDFPEKHANGCKVLETYVALFPYEYASLRDRPTMQESLDMLRRAQEN